MRQLGIYGLLLGLLLIGAALAICAPVASAMPGDTLWVRTFDHDLYNWVGWHQQTFTFPDTSLYYRKVVIFYRLECPGAPIDCDPWDRKGTLRIVREPNWTEIARVITPYDITGGNRPGHCTWEIDATDYEPLLHGDVTLAQAIDTYIGEAGGWIVTVDFAFIEGVPALKPFEVIDLWQSDYAAYGNPENPIENFLSPRTLTIDPRANAVKFRMVTTGHGQGNTANCAEFCMKKHKIKVNTAAWEQYLWRSDCEANTCSPQGGTWLIDRAGWCPGDKVTPWDIDVTGAVTPGAEATLDYDIATYNNLCRPNNPDCNTQICPSGCEYDGGGHTEPHWMIQTQLIYYRAIPVADADASIGGDGTMLLQNQPNPFQPNTWIRYTLSRPGDVRLVVHDAAGRFIREIRRAREGVGTYAVEWDGKDSQGADAAAGVYFYTLETGEGNRTQKMILLR